jgi:hypothetical protein
MSESDTYTGRCSQPTTGLSTGFPNGGVKERTEGAEGVCNPIERTTASTNQTHQSSQGLTTNQRAHMVGLMAPASYAEGDGLVRH